MRVLFWSTTFWPHIGGVEVLATKLLPALRQRGHEYMVFVRSSPGLPAADEYEGIPIHRFPFWHALANIDPLVETRRQISRLKRSFAPDLIHLNAIGLGTVFHHLTANVHPAPLLVTLHGAWPQGANAHVARALRAADWVVGCSAAILEQGRQLVPEIDRRSSVIHNSLDLPPLLPTPLPNNAPRLLCLGRLDADKGFDLALVAFGAIHDRFPQARLVVAGDGPARAELEQQAGDLGLSDLVDFVGWVAPENVPALMNRVTVVVIPSRQESFGLVALEAALMARPVVATRVGGLPEVIVHQQTGLLVKPDSSSALAKAMALLLEQPSTAAQMGQAARRRAQDVFNWARYVDAYDTLYQHLVAEASPASRPVLALEGSKI